MIPGSTVELEVRGVRPSTPEAVPVAAVVRRRDRADDQVLCVTIGAGDAHALWHELHGQETPRSQAVGVVSRLAEALGARLAAALLVADGPGQLTARFEVETPGGSVGVPATPGQALAAAVCLGVPLLADAALFPADAAVVLGDPIAAFLDSLDLRALEGQGS